MQKDYYESNDTFETAYILNDSFGYEDLNISAGDNDYFKINLNNTGTAYDYIQASFKNADGDLNLELYDAECNFLQGCYSKTDNERLSLENLQPGEYYVKVYGKKGAINDYKLEWNTNGFDPRADNYEPNDTFQTASILYDDSGAIQNLNIASNDEDYFRITLNNPGTKNDYVQALFKNAAGNLNLEVYDANHDFVAGGYTTSDNERVSLENLNPGYYYVKVYGKKGATNDYDLEWNTSGVALGADECESNDTFDMASPLEGRFGNIPELNITNGDEDYFKITLDNPGTKQDYINAIFKNSEGDLNIELYDSSHNFVKGSYTGSDNESLNLDGLNPGDYYVKVYGKKGATNNYDLEWNTSGTAPGADGYEANDTFQTASQLYTDSGSIQNLNITSSDEDYFKITLNSTGNKNDYVQALFKNADGNLNLEVFDASHNFVAGGYTNTDDERVSLENLNAGDYYVKVYGKKGATNDYDLEWNTSGTAPGADGYEFNDTFQTASLLYDDSGAIQGLNITSNDEDYFKITLNSTGNKNDYVQALFKNADGNLNLEVYDASHNFVAGGYTNTDDERVSLENLNAGDYYVKVYGKKGATNDYDLEWNTSGTVPGADEYEFNDTFDMASHLYGSYGSIAELNITSGDEDYFRITLDNRGTKNDYIDALFKNSDGDLNLELYDNSHNFVKGSYTGSDNESISLDGLNPGDYYVKVYGKKGATNDYALEWNTSGFNRRPDRFEPNNDKLDATALTAVKGTESGLTTSSSDHDFYKFNLTQPGKIGNFIGVDFRHNEGDIDIQLYGPDGNCLSSASTSDNEYINLRNLPAGEYYLEVYSCNADPSEYTLNWNFDTVKARDFAHSQFKLVDGDVAYVMGTNNLTASSFDSNGLYHEKQGATVIDAEKSYSNPADDNLCWAGSLSNMLAWTGWGQKALDFSDWDKAEDTIFQNFIDNFEDGGSAFEYGLNWFFSGDYLPAGVSGWAQPTGPGNYLGVSAKLFIDELFSNTSFDDGSVVTAKDMAALSDYLDYGAGAYVSLGWYDSPGAPYRDGGHAITCWGYTYDPTQVKGTAAYYTGLIISDSDNNKEYDNPLDAPDTLKIMDLSWNDAWGGYYIAGQDYPDGQDARLEYFGILLPEDAVPYGVGMANINSGNQPYLIPEINGGDFI